jgi:hypothetical protein
MPKDFTDCVKSGGKVVTKQLKGNRYINICYGKNGKSYSGEIKTKKKSKGFKQRANQIKKSRALVNDLQKLKDHFNEKRNG